jgi:hypothetical protein
MYGEVYIGNKRVGYVNSDFKVIYYTPAQLLYFDLIEQLRKIYEVVHR